jgi:hypothetical protein
VLALVVAVIMGVVFSNHAHNRIIDKKASHAGLRVC